MSRSTTRGYWRQVGSRGASPAVLPATMTVSFAGNAAAATPTGKFMPKGARVLEVLYNGAATGGASPTFDLGYVGATSVLVNEGDADAGPGRTLVMAAPLLEDSEVVGGVGASAATGGTVTATIVFVMDDDGSLNS